MLSEIKTPTVDVLYLRGNIHLKLGGSEHNHRAIDDFSKAINLYRNPDSKIIVSKLEIYYKRAWVHHILGEYDEAISDYSDFIIQSKYSEKPNERELLPKGFIGRGLVYESMQLLQQAYEDINEGIQSAKEFPSYSENPYYTYCLGRIRIALKEREIYFNDNTYQNNIERGKINDTGKYFETIKENENDTSQPLPSEKGNKSNDMIYEKYYYQALLLSEEGRNTEALQLFEKATLCARTTSEEAECIFRQGLCQYELGKKTTAQNSFELAKQKDPTHGRSMFRLGMMQAAEKRNKEALQNLTIAFKCAPNSVDILYERANVFERLGKLEEAMCDRRQAMQSGKSASTTILMLEDRLRQLRAEILQHGESSNRHLKLGWIQETLSEFQKCHDRSNAHNQQNNQTKGQNLNQNEAYLQAVKEYEEAIRIDTENICPEARALLSLWRREGKDYFSAHIQVEELFKQLLETTVSKEMWKLFIKNIKQPSYWNAMGFFPPDYKIKEFETLDKSAKKITEDEDSFKYDDNNNRRLFYEGFRIRLSNTLAAFAVAGTNEQILAHNLKGTCHQ